MVFILIYEAQGSEGFLSNHRSPKDFNISQLRYTFYSQNRVYTIPLLQSALTVKWVHSTWKMTVHVRVMLQITVGRSRISCMRSPDLGILSPYYNQFPPQAGVNSPLPAATTELCLSHSGGQGSPSLWATFPCSANLSSHLCPSVGSLPLHPAWVPPHLLDPALSRYPSHEASFCGSQRATSSPWVVRLTLFL